jgi:Ca-activated chloride channel family protein
MQFAAAGWLVALAVPLVLWLAIKAGDRRAAARATRLLGPQSVAQRENWFPRQRGWRRFAYLAGLCWLALALARPQWGASEVTVTQRGHDVVIALDVSRSMLAQDVVPSRLERAKAELTAFLRRQTESRVGLVLFAGAAFVQCPLTTDLGTAEVFLRMAAPDMISTQGTALATALRVSREVLESGGGKDHGAGFQAILLVTDGEDLEGNWEQEAELCRRADIQVIPVGIGEETGGLIPLTDEQGRSAGFLKDSDGDLVLSRLDLASLERLAALGGGGSAFRVGRDGLAGERLRAVFAELGQREFEQRQITRWQERYQWPLGLALLHLSLAIAIRARRPSRAKHAGALGVRSLAAVVALCLSAATTARAELVKPGWAAAMERGRAAYASGDFETALREFEQARAQAPDDPRLALAVGESLFHLERLDEAAREFARARALSNRHDLKAESLYNAGTTALAQGAPQEAVDFLRESLRLDPGRRDALHNLEAALWQLQAQKEQEQRQDASQDQQDQQDQQDRNERQEQRDQQTQDQQDSQEQSEPADAENPPEPQPQEQSEQPAEPQELDREQALQLLQALDRDEEELKRSVQQRLRGDVPRSKREW